MDLPKPRFQRSPLLAREQFREALGTWFSREGKDYPWRRTRDPYAILVSEVMLQQTQIATVLGKTYYERFLLRFPDMATLAAAGDESLLKAWEGLGYYRRARMLRETARAVTASHGGTIPASHASLLALPGIGPYTAAALMAFAFGQASALVDGNVSRVLSRLMDDTTPIDSTPGRKLHFQWAGALCDPQHPARHHHAMMELGQTICRPGIPRCGVCPVSRFCKTRSPETLPNKKPRAKTTELTEHALWLRDAKGRLLLHQEPGQRRNGLWKLPLRSPEDCADHPVILKDQYPITRYKVRLHVHLAGPSDFPVPREGEQWIPLAKIETLPLAAPFRRAIDRILPDFQNRM
jgi:A/G-specific adenine glycosylase